MIFLIKQALFSQTKYLIIKDRLKNIFNLKINRAKEDRAKNH
jgi:hypothetical protein